ncbi:MAG: flagellar biosynthesis protein FlhF [Treponema sp.]|jgi:flagellar biosynthesis protein FlhF|nr:flagellar biosynthesis protein FlhF [Treponema sp.]
MVQFTEQALSFNDCLDKIRAKYGELFYILSQKPVRVGGFLGFFTREGIELSGYVPNSYGKNVAGNISYQGAGSQSQGVSAGVSGGRYSPSGGSPVTGMSGGGAVSRQAAETAIPRNEPINFEERKRDVIAAAGKDLTMEKVLVKLSSIEERIKEVSTVVPVPEEHPNLTRLEEILTLNDFSRPYQEKLLERVRKECPLDTLEDFEALQDQVLEWIGESISIFQEKPVVRPPRIIVLVGPTGVGKTTTIAKLAAIYGLNNTNPLSVRMITIDAIRIGARAQIEAYGEIIGIPVSYVDNREDLRKVIALYAEGVDLVLIDTFGKSPRDAVKLGEMKQILDAAGTQAEIHLSITAATKSSDMADILRQFEPFNYQSVIITKMDETSRMGNVISVLSEKGKPVSYITDGQTVPSDIRRADVISFLINLGGFRVKRQKLEERFPLNKSDEIQWR